MFAFFDFPAVGVLSADADAKYSGMVASSTSTTAC
jgi:hypothetical protein